MNKVIVSSKARWVLQELIPIVLALALGLYAVFSYITEQLTKEGATILGVAGFGLAAFLIFVNLQRKHKSTLFAEMTQTDDSSLLTVHMRKPNKEKWGNKMDKTHNTGDLSDLKTIKVVNIMGTLTIVFGLGDKNVYIPARLISSNNKVRLFLVNALKNVGADNVSFDNATESDQFTALLTNKKISTTIHASPASGKAVQVDPTAELRVKTNKPVAHKPAGLVEHTDNSYGDDAEEPDSGLFTGSDVVQATKVIGYDKYRRKSAEELVDEAIKRNEMEEVKDINRNLLGGFNTPESSPSQTKTD